jgi:methylmalonyl-CoA/ethylmalonyl-CoA epimerase
VAGPFRSLHHICLVVHDIAASEASYESIGDCPQRRFLDTRGEGVFHLGFEAVLDDAVPRAEAAGLDVLMSGRRENGTGFTYYDTLARTGVVWLNRQSRP